VPGGRDRRPNAVVELQLNRVDLNDVLSDPSGVPTRLLADVWGLTECTLLWANRGAVAYRLQLEPWLALRDEGYPTERVGLMVAADGNVYATPHQADGRAWRHRYSWQASMFGQLCLWDPSDPAALRWDWQDGLVSFVTIVHRHLQAEEFARRHGVWPAEDSPHGAGLRPLRTEQMRSAAVGWRR